MPTLPKREVVVVDWMDLNGEYAAPLLRDANTNQDIQFYKDCNGQFGVQKFVSILLYHQNL